MAIGRIGVRDQGVTTIETYRYTATGGQTSVSGADLGGRTLIYPVNYEVVFLNGVRLVRGDDYQATTGNSITGIAAMTAGDSIEVMVFQAVDIANAITNAQAAATYAPLVSPALTGTPTVPTAAADTNTTQAASTAFVLGQASATNPSALGSVAVGTSLRYARQDHVHPTTGLGLTSGGLNQFAATTSSQLAGVISDETGSGSLVFASSPTLSTVTINSGGLNVTAGGIKLSAGNVLEAPFVTNAQTANYTLVLADAGKLIEMNSASALTLTIPADASVAFPVGTKIDILQTGAGQVTIAGSGFTPNATPGLKISAQWGAASLVKRGTNSWVVIGNLAA